MVKAARSFKKLQEILSDAKKKHGRTLAADVTDVVTRFCEDDEIFSIDPGKKVFPFV
jgi:hypothetical protein